MRKISVYTRDGESGSSSYYRILQYFDEIKKEDNFNVVYKKFVPIKVTKLFYNKYNNIFVKLLYHFCVFWGALIHFIGDLLVKPEKMIILRAAVPKTFIFPLKQIYSTLVKNKKIDVIWDFDDDIFFSNEISKNERNLLERNSDIIFVTHSHLKNKISKKYQNKVSILPTTDKSYFSIESNNVEFRLEKYTKMINVVWIGSSASNPYLTLFAEGIDEASKILLETINKKLELNIISNLCFNYPFVYAELKNTIWTRNAAIEAMGDAHIGIMPLPDGEFEKGKGSFKIIQYMANSLPVIASDVGNNINIVAPSVGFLVSNKDELVSAILKLSTDIDEWHNMSLESYNIWRSNFNFDKNLEIWKKAISEHHHQL